MRKILVVFALISINTFAQEAEFVPESHVIFEVNQDFGNLIASDTLHAIKNPSFAVAGTSFRITGSFKTKSGMFFETYAQSTMFEYYSQAQSNKIGEIQYVYVDNSSRIGYYYGENSQFKSNMFALGFNLQKRVSKYFSIGGGFQLQYRISEFVDYVTVFGQTQNSSGEFVDIYNDLVESKGKSKSISYGIPIVSRIYLPVGVSGKNNLIISGSLTIGKQAYTSVGLGFSF